MVTIRNRPRPESQFLDVFDEDQVSKAITYRKAKFDEGAERVQSQINQLGQLPSITPEDSLYISNKISSLTTNINSIAGLDTSNQFNINKLSSMTNAIVEDPTVQYAISSAKNDQKNQKYIEDAKMNPKKYGNTISIQNEDDYNVQRNKYKKERSEGKQSIFSYTYKPYKDVEDILTKKMEKIKSSSTPTMNGSYIYNNEVIEPKMIKNIAMQEIQSDPSLQEQLRINSNYSIRGVTDESLLASKNKIQLLELEERKYEAKRKFVEFYKIDLSKPKEAAKFIKNFGDSYKEYESYSTFLKENPNRIINSDTGRDATKEFNREQVAYEITHQNLIEALSSKLSYSKTKVQINPVPLQEANLTWDKQQFNLQFNFEKLKAKEDRDFQMLKLTTENLGRSTKVKVDENGIPSYGTANILPGDTDYQALATEQANESKTKLVNGLKTMITDKLSDIMAASGANASSVFVKKFVDNIVTQDGQIRNINENTNIKMFQDAVRKTSGVLPDAIAIREGFKLINSISKDVKNMWDNAEYISPKNLTLLRDTQESIHEVLSFNASKKLAMIEALRFNGISKEDYKYFNDKMTKEKQSFGYGMQINNTKDKASFNKVDAVNKSISEYYLQRGAFAKKYGIVNFDPESDNNYDFKNDIRREITEGNGKSTDGTANLGGSVNGKVDKWSDLIYSKTAEIIPLDYDPKNEVSTVKIIDIDKNGNKVLDIKKFYVKRSAMEKYIPKNVSSTLNPNSYAQQLMYTEDGKITARKKTTNGEEIKDVYKLTSSKIPIYMMAQRAEHSNLSNGEVFVRIKIPINGVYQVIKLSRDGIDTKYRDADYAFNDISTKINSIISEQEKLGKNQKQVHDILLKKLQQIND